jgi:predicted kinase
VPSPLPSSRHVLLYGPPAAGKLTVANALADRHEFRVLDNHAAVDPALRLFRFGQPEMSPLVRSIRETLFEAAARSGIDVVSTFVYAHPRDTAHLQRLIEICQKYGAHIVLVQLLASQPVLESRVIEHSRAGTRKLQDPATLRRMLQQLDLHTPFPGTHLSIDNSDIAVAEVVDTIASYCRL